MRAGRKRKDGPRHPSGKLVQPRSEPRDEGTPELQAQRLEAFGDRRARRELNCPLERLRTRLSERQVWAGQIARQRYSRFCAAILSPRIVIGPLRDFVDGGGESSMSPAHAMEARSQYIEMVTQVKRFSARSLKAVERIMHGTLPHDLDSLAIGLEVIADYLGLPESEEREAA